MMEGKKLRDVKLKGGRVDKSKHIELLKDHPEWEKLYTFISRDIERSRE